MERVFGIMLTLLLIGMSTLAFNVAPVSGHSGDVLSAWTDTIPTIDGVIGSTEWASTDTISFPLGELTGILYVMNDADNLYVGLQVNDDEFHWSDAVRISFDNDHDGGILEGGDESIFLSVNWFSDDYYHHELLALATDIAFGGTNDGTGAASRAGTWNHFEISHPLDSADDEHDFSLSAGDTVGFMIGYADGPLPFETFPSSTWFYGSTSRWADIVIASPPAIVSATTDIDPDTLNLKSNGQWITTYIELPESYNLSDIDISTIKLNNTVSVDPDAPIEIDDYDEDRIQDLMVKFDRQEVIALLSVSEATLTITGEVNGASFEGSDTIRVIDE